MLAGKRSNTFGLTIHSTADGTQPATTMGTSVTPAQNAYGAYAQLISGANLTDDCYELVVNVNNVGISASARDCVVSIGLDPTGGTSYTSLVDLVCGPAGGYIIAGGGGVSFRFPIFIAAGTSIGAAASVNSATLTAIGVFCRVRCRPTHPESLILGRYIDQFGVTLASSAGTAITQGGASEGSYTQIGVALTRPLKWLEFGFGYNSSAMPVGVSVVDIAVGDATNKLIVIPNAVVPTTTTEAILKAPHGEPCGAAIGDLLYARAQTNNVTAGASVAIYGVG